ncbi:MerR family transcriptional regulator [Nocardioides sp.]|uniref:MerR family transcriptional regulator n=1 Tax=Nocardioides sp. TaxID=35761 RepID=UPI002ED0F39C
MYTIKHAAELVGVSVSTLRAWERRYDLIAPRRTDAGYRLYDADSVRALITMRGLVLAGWSARQAAEETRRRTADRSPLKPPAALHGPAPNGDIEALVRVAEDFDVTGLATVLDHEFSTASFEAVADGWLLPAMRQLGLAWESGRVTVAAEHLVSEGVVRRLNAAFEASGAAARGPRVLVGLPAGARHEVALLAFAVATRRAGLATTYLGADVPTAQWAAAATLGHAVCVVLAVSMPEDVVVLEDVVESLAAAHPALLVAVGGGLQDHAPQSCLRLGHEIGSAAAHLASQLSARSPFDLE